MQKQKQYFYIITVRGPFGHETFSGAYTVTRPITPGEIYLQVYNALPPHLRGKAVVTHWTLMPNTTIEP